MNIEEIQGAGEELKRLIRQSPYDGAGVAGVGAAGGNVVGTAMPGAGAGVEGAELAEAGVDLGASGDELGGHQCQLRRVHAG